MIENEGDLDMKKLLIFDLDSTLAPIGKGMGEEELKELKKIEETGIRIAICSGKTCDYLCGFMRQIGIQEPILIGENGAVIRFGVELPPKQHYRVPFPDKVVKTLRQIREELEKQYPHIWFQPNKVGVTPFPTSEEEFEEISEFLNKKELEDVEVYRHVDSFDIVPAGINKAVGITYLLERLGITKEDVIAVGDGVNDYVMFDLAGFSVGVDVKEENRVKVNCKNTLEMLQFLQKYLRN